MERTIELTNELPKRTNTAFLIAKDLYRATKFVAIASIVFVGVDFAKGLYKIGVDRALAAKEAYITSEVVNSLATQTIEFDDKKGVAKPATAMSRDELLRALYLLNSEVQSKQEVINHLKDTLSFE